VGNSLILFICCQIFCFFEDTILLLQMKDRTVHCTKAKITIRIGGFAIFKASYLFCSKYTKDMHVRIKPLINSFHKLSLIAFIYR